SIEIRDLRGGVREVSCESEVAGAVREPEAGHSVEPRDPLLVREKAVEQRAGVIPEDEPRKGDGGKRSGSQKAHGGTLEDARIREDPVLGWLLARRLPEGRRRGF